MGHWVTLDDEQHVYISDDGKVLATRSAISAGEHARKVGAEHGTSLREQADKARAARGDRQARAAQLMEKAKAYGKAAYQRAVGASGKDQELFNRMETQQKLSAGRSKWLNVVAKNAMNEQQAKSVAERFKQAGATGASVQEFGYKSGIHHVEIWHINPQSGNRLVETIRQNPTDSEIKEIIARFKGSAKTQDRAAHRRMAAERGLI